MIRAFFRGTPRTQKRKPCMSAAPNAIELEAVLSVLKLLTQNSACSQKSCSSLEISPSLLDRLKEYKEKRHPEQTANHCPPLGLPPAAGNPSNSQPAQHPQWANTANGAATDFDSLAISSAIVPTSLEKEALSIYTQLLIENSNQVNHRRHQKLRHLDKVLFIGSCIYLVGVVGWLVNHGLTRSVESDRAIIQAEQHQESSQAHQKVEKETAASPEAEFLPPPSQPVQTSQSDDSPTDTTQPVARQRENVPVPPVRQLPTLEMASVPTPIPVPPPPKPISLPTAIPPKAPAPPLAQAPAPVPVPPEASSATATDSSAENASPSSPAPSTSTAVPASPPVLTSKAPSPPLINSRLVGILQLGDRSVALFDHNDVTQRVQVGDRIGSSGWTLGALTAQTAEIYRDQEKRSLSVGEGF